MPLLAQRSSIIKGSATAAMTQKADDLKAKGIKPVYLVQGEPDFITPENIRQAAYRAMEAGKTNYTPAQGLPELREAISEWELKNNDVKSDPKSEIVVTNGSYQAIFLSLMVTVDPGEEVILTDPFFGPYKNVINLVGGVPVYVPCHRVNNHFVIPPEGLESAVTKKTKAIILNTPWNPTGTVMTRDELQEIGKFAEKNDLYIIVDEIYCKLIYGGAKHCSIASLSDDLRHRTITVNGFSKSFAMTGWRLGYMIADKEICQPATRMNHHTGRCATNFVQYAGLAGLTGPQDEVQKMVEAYDRRRSIMAEGINSINGLTCINPEGTFYIMVDHTAFGVSSSEFTMFLLEEAGVVVSPGDYYGKLGEGYVRLSFCTSDEDISEAIDRIGNSVGKLGRAGS